MYELSGKREGPVRSHVHVDVKPRRIVSLERSDVSSGVKGAILQPGQWAHNRGQPTISAAALCNTDKCDVLTSTITVYCRLSRNTHP